MSDKLPSILLVEPDEGLLTILSYNLERYGFIVNHARDAETALAFAEKIQPSLIVVEEELPGSMQGEQLCSVIRSKSLFKNSILLLITAAGIKEDSVVANDFIRKPFVPSELVSKIKSLLVKFKPSNSNRVLEYKDIKMNVSSCKVTKNGRDVHLGPIEFKILQCLMELPTKILSREYIMNQVWGYNRLVDARTIDVHINRLRSALKNDNELDPMPLIKTVRSAGYCLSAPKE